MRSSRTSLTGEGSQGFKAEGGAIVVGSAPFPTVAAGIERWNLDGQPWPLSPSSTPSASPLCPGELLRNTLLSRSGKGCRGRGSYRRWEAHLRRLRRRGSPQGGGPHFRLENHPGAVILLFDEGPSSQGVRGGRADEPRPIEAPRRSARDPSVIEVRGARAKGRVGSMAGLRVLLPARPVRDGPSHQRRPIPDAAATRKATRAAAIPAFSIFWAWGASPLNMLARAARNRRSATVTAAR